MDVYVCMVCVCVCVCVWGGEWMDGWVVGVGGCLEGGELMGL